MPLLPALAFSLVQAAKANTLIAIVLGMSGYLAMRTIAARNEAKQKFGKFTPRSLGQALRISGITPADVTVLAIHLDRRRASCVDAQRNGYGSDAGVAPTKHSPI